MTILRLREPALVDPLDEVAEHLLADLEVRDHPVFERAYRLDVTRRPADHPLRLRSDCERPSVLDVHRHDGRLVQDDPSSSHVDEGVGGAEVDGHVATEQEEAVVPPWARSLSWSGLGGSVRSSVAQSSARRAPGLRIRSQG